MTIQETIQSLLSQDGWSYLVENLEDLYLSGELTDDVIDECEKEVWEEFEVDLLEVRQTAKERKARRDAYAAEQEEVKAAWENSLHGRYARGEFPEQVTITLRGQTVSHYVGGGGAAKTYQGRETFTQQTLVKVGDFAYKVIDLVDYDLWMRAPQYRYNPNPWGSWEKALERA